MKRADIQPEILIPSFVMNFVSLFVDLMYWYAKNAPNITNPTKIVVVRTCASSLNVETVSKGRKDSHR